MKIPARLLLAAAALAALLPPARAGNDPSGVVLLVNESHPDSAPVADHYAARRRLPPKQVLRLRVPVKPELTLEEYRSSVEEPLRGFLLREDLEERARCLVLSRGFPVRVRLGAGFVSTAALLQCMDLPFAGAPQPGIPGTPLDHLRPEERANPFREGPFPEDRRPGGRPLRLVTALDGWTAADAKALVDRSVAADAGPPADPLFVFQDAGGGASGRNAGYPEAAETLRRAGFRVEAVPAGKDRVRGRKDLMGWMSGGAYSALDDEGVLSNAFAPGALVDMLESFGAVPGNFDEKGARSQYPVPAMVRAGASGVHGAVAEPYAHTFPAESIFLRYTSGLDLAEAFHGSLPFLHWMNLVLGDPLCAPFARRPRVEIEGLPARVSSGGAVAVRVRAAAAPGGESPVALSLFLDGEPAGTAEGEAAEFTLDPAAGPDGPRTLLAVARTGGAARTRGWAVGTLEVAVAAPRVVERTPRADALAAPPSTPVVIRWAGSASPPPRLSLLDGAGRPVEGRASVDAASRRASFAPASPLAPGAAYSVAVEGPAGLEGHSFTVGAAALAAAGPAGSTAGEEVLLRVAAAGAAPGSRALAGERIEAWLADPPVLAASVDVPGDAAGPAEIRLRPTKAGRCSIRLLGRRSGAEGGASVEVAPAAAASLFLRLGPRTPAGEPFDLAVEARDPFGNAVPGWTGTVTLRSNDPAATLPPPVAVGPADRGRALFRGIAFATPGVRALAAEAEGGLAGADDTEVVAPSPLVGRWLLFGPFDGGGKGAFDLDLLPGDDGARRPSAASVLEGRPWRAAEAPKALLDPGKEVGALLAVAYLSFPAEGEADLVLGHGGRLRAWFAGREVYEGAASGKAEEERGRVRVKLPAGPAALVLRLEVRGGGQDSFGARLLRPDGSAIPGMRVLRERPFPPDALSISGFVRDGKGPLADVEVRLSGRGSGRTRTDARGWYGFGGLRPGDYRVAPRIPGRKPEPESASAKLQDAEKEGLDFLAR